MTAAFWVGKCLSFLTAHCEASTDAEQTIRVVDLWTLYRSVVVDDKSVSLTIFTQMLKLTLAYIRWSSVLLKLHKGDWVLAGFQWKKQQQPLPPRPAPRPRQKKCRSCHQVLSGLTSAQRRFHQELCVSRPIGRKDDESEVRVRRPVISLLRESEEPLAQRVRCIKSHRYQNAGGDNGGTPEFLVSWEALDAVDTWEPPHSFIDRDPVTRVPLAMTDALHAYLQQPHIRLSSSLAEELLEDYAYTLETDSWHPKALVAEDMDYTMMEVEEEAQDAIILY